MNDNRPPNLDSEAICSLLKELYPFEDVDRSSVKELPGYEDRNFYFKGRLNPEAVSCATEEFILKVSHLTNSCELLEGVNEVMDHLKSRDFRCNYAIRNNSGEKIALLSENQLLRGNPSMRTGRAAQYPVRVLTYVPGETLEAVQITPRLAFDVGMLAGSIDKALLDFSHPVLDHRTFSCAIWDLRNFLQIKTLLDSFNMDNQQRNIIDTTMSNFGKFVQPLISSFSQGILHGDIGPQNIVQKRGDSTAYGVIDFGDCMRNCHLFELATMIHGFLSNGNLKQEIQSTSPLVVGYTYAFPLSNEELGCLYYVVLARMCVAAVATELNLQTDPGNGYLREVVQQSWRAAQVFFSHPKEKLDELWTDAIKEAANY